MAYAITAMSDKAESFLNTLCDQYVNMGAIIDVMNADLKGPHAIDSVPLFSGLSLKEFGGSSYQFAQANHSEAFTPNAGGGNSGRGPQGRDH